MASPASPPRPLRRHGLALLLALASFLVVSSFVRSLVPWPGSSGLREKLAQLAVLRDEIDVLYVGSSAVFRSFRPTIIDAELAARGHPLRSYNLGAGGLVGFEAAHVLDAVLALAPARLRWVVFEPTQFDGALAGQPNVWSDRSVGWHTPALTAAAIRSVWRSATPLASRLADTALHLQLAARRFVAYGSGPAIVEQLLGRDGDDRILSPEELDRERGFQALDALTGPEFLARREALLADLDEYAQRVALLESRVRQRAPLEDIDTAPYLRLRRAVERAGAELLAVLPPKLQPTPHAATLQAEGIVQGLLALNVPSREPELFAPEHRFDSNHLNAAGATLFSRRFAAAFADLLDAR